MADPRTLRRNQTDAERRLWAELRGRRLGGLKFRRQHPIGPYVADFACPEAKIVVEVDGGQHARQAAWDLMRSQWMETDGYRVLRFWNNEVLGNLVGVLETILRACREATPPHPAPLPRQAGERET